MKWKRMMYAFTIFSLYFICVKGMRINYNFTSINEKKKWPTFERNAYK